MPYLRMFPDSIGDGTPVRELVAIVRQMAYTLNSMEGLGCRVVKQVVGPDVARITIDANGSSDTPLPAGGEPPYLGAQDATDYPVFAYDTEGIAYVRAMKDTEHGGTIGWLPVFESCPPPEE